MTDAWEQNWIIFNILIILMSHIDIRHSNEHNLLQKHTINKLHICPNDKKMQIFANNLVEA